MARLTPALLALMFAACGPKAADLSAPVDPEVAPVLPAPEAGNYALGEAQPRDLLVAKVVSQGLLPWVESLSGAATSLALEASAPLDLPLARHAAWRAGYPYPVVRLIEGSEEWAAFPSGLLDALKEQVRPGDHVGVVRARLGPTDRWVALVGRPGGLLDPFPRMVPTGAEVVLQTDRSATWTAVRPDGSVATGTAPAALRADQGGEWWLELKTRDGALLAAAPLWVGMQPPPAPLVELPGTPALGPEDARLEALDTLDLIRESHGLALLEEDQLLTSLATVPAEQRAAQTWARAKGEQRLLAAGFEGSHVMQVTCSAATVAACFDDLLHTAETRAVLLHPQARLMGADAVVETKAVHVALNLTSD